LINEASNFRYKLWENHDLTMQQVITNIYLCERAMVCNLFTLLFKPPSCNGPETELKCKIGFRTSINNICILSYTNNWCLVPFCINISGDSPNRMSVFWLQEHSVISDTVLCGGWEGGGGHREQGAEQENSYTNYAVINRLPLTAMLGRANEASRWNGLRRTATRIFRSK